LRDIPMNCDPEDLNFEHYRYDPELPQKWEAVRPVVMWFGGEPLYVEYCGQPGHAVALVHAYLQSEHKLTKRRH
jgi:hypothetical protein